MNCEMVPPPDGFGEAIEPCPHVELEVSALPKCKICGYVSEPQFGCIPRMESHLKVAHRIEPTQGRAFWICCAIPRRIP